MVSRDQFQPWLNDDTRYLGDAPTRVRKSVEFVRKRWDPAFTIYAHGDSPWTAVARPLEESRVAVVSTAGFYLKGEQEPFAYAGHPYGDDGVRVLPANLEQEQLAIAHEHYDHVGPAADFNVVLPLDRLQELADSGEIGTVADHHYSISGYNTRQLPLVTGSAVHMLEGLREDDVDVVLLVPV